MLIRPRQDDDLDACADLVRDVHLANGYPRYLSADLRAFLAPSASLGSWVADEDGKVIGHVALLPRGPQQVMDIAAGSLSRPEDQLAVVARLLVSPQVRGKGVGGQLLDTATGSAHSRGLWPILDVSVALASAIALYEGRGWVRAGTVTVRFKDGNSLEEHVYIGPRP